MKTEYKTIEVEVKEGIAILKLNNPPVNQLSESFVREMADAIREAFQDQEVKAVILTGTGKNFIAGADITEIKGMRDKDLLFSQVMERHRFMNAIEDGPRPVIAAINGHCLGGGLELAMACHYRIAAPHVQVGQPEVKLGLIPGSGGTQRLPRLVGLPDALQMITTGNGIPAEEGRQKGCIDEVAPHDRLLEKSVDIARRFISGELDHSNRRTRIRTDRLPNPEQRQTIIALARQMAEEKARGYIAPFKAIEAMEQGLSDDFEADIQGEAELFCDCAVSEIAKNLIGIFLHTRAAGRLPRIEGIRPREIRTVGMLGGGVMGSGIVNLLLGGGFNTILWDIDKDAIQKGLSATRKTFAYPIKKGKMTEEDLDMLIQEHLTTTLSIEDMGKADLVVEAVVEDMKIKQDLWRRIEGIVRTDAVFGTNTSALPISEMASVLADPGRMIGLHFFNPAERMQLLEIICGKDTSDEALAASVGFARAIGKVPIVVNDGPGFYVSRQLAALMGESTFMVGEGIAPARIEEAMLEFGMPMGPATLSDLTGIDIGYHVGKNFEKAFGERWKMSPLYEKVYQTGCYGRKNGAGWYDYTGEEPVPNPKVLQVVEGYLKEQGIAAKEVPSQEIVDRMLARAINEAAYIIREGICDRPQDMDLAMIYGAGFPPFRGGILRYADTWGIRTVYEHLVNLEAEHGIRLKPAALLKEMAESGETFYQD
jgi:3-hydroxyacyl-CoA dehydrogenase/enoyl-CoA hydratase/carnithine racemase